MAKFKFRLEKLLEYRRLQEGWAKDAYLVALARQHEAESLLASTETRKSRAMASHPSGLDERRSLDSYLTRLDDEIRAHEAAISVVTDEAVAALEEYQNAKKEASVIEKLRETRLAEWKLAQSRKEQADLDEWATQRRAA